MFAIIVLFMIVWVWLGWFLWALNKDRDLKVKIFLVVVSGILLGTIFILIPWSNFVTFY